MRHLVVLYAAVLVAGCTAKVPKRWAKLGMPSRDLDTVRDDTNANRLSADYRGCTAGELAARVDAGLKGHGYRQVCDLFHGAVRGYSNGSEKLLAKVDLMGPVIALTVGDKRGADPVLYAACFEGAHIGTPTRVK